MRIAAALSVFVLCALVLMPGPAVSQDDALPQVTLDGRIYAFIPQLSMRYGVDLQWNPTDGMCRLRQETRTVEGRLGSARWLVNGRFMDGHGPLRVFHEVPVLLVDDLPLVLTGVLGREVASQEVAALLGVAPPGGQRPALTNVRTIPYPRYSRLVLTFDAPVEYRVTRERSRRLRIDLPGVDVGGVLGPIEVGDDVLKTVGWKASADDMVVTVLTTEPQAEYDAYYLEDPVRLILDFSRDTDAAPLVAVPGSGGTPVMPQAGQPELAPPEREQLTTVVIDPGHGGRDPGAQGPGGLFEKVVTLALAQELKARLERELGLHVVLTRTGDYHLSIAERAQAANTARDGKPADLFISIHTNAHPSVRAGGFEAYFASAAMDPTAEALAAFENAAGEWNVPTAESESDLLRQVLWDLQHAAFVEESNAFAVLAQEHLGRSLAIENRGVKQAPFLVLSGCAMPAVLIEAAFITNRAEEVKLQTPEFQQNVAGALANAVADFKALRARRLGIARSGGA